MDEDDLSADKLASFKAIILTEPDIPVEGQTALVAWLKRGGHLLTVTGAAAGDRYNQPCTVLSSATGIREAARPRITVHDPELLVISANGTGDLGPISAWGLRGHIKSTASDVKALARFTDDTPAIVTTKVGAGVATHFAFLPGIRHPSNDPYHPQIHFNNLTNASDGSLPYLLKYIKDARVQPRVHVSEMQVETMLLTSAVGAVVTLLNWRESPVESLDVRVLTDFPIEKVTAVQGGTKLTFNCTPADGSGYWVGFTTPLEHADLITLSAKKLVRSGKE